MINKIDFIGYLTTECGSWRNDVLKVGKYGYEKLSMIHLQLCNGSFWDD